MVGSPTPPKLSAAPSIWNLWGAISGKSNTPPAAPERDVSTSDYPLGRTDDFDGGNNRLSDTQNRSERSLSQSPENFSAESPDRSETSERKVEIDTNSVEGVKSAIKTAKSIVGGTKSITQSSNNAIECPQLTEIPISTSQVTYDGPPSSSPKELPSSLQNTLDAPSSLAVPQDELKKTPGVAMRPQVHRMPSHPHPENPDKDLPTKRRRYKRYERTSSHLIINPSSESEVEPEDLDNEKGSSLLQTAVYVENGTDLFHSLDSEIMSELMNERTQLEILEATEVSSGHDSEVLEGSYSSDVLKPEDVPKNEHSDEICENGKSENSGRFGKDQSDSGDGQNDNEDVNSDHCNSSATSSAAEDRVDGNQEPDRHTGYNREPNGDRVDSNGNESARAESRDAKPEDEEFDRYRKSDNEPAFDKAGGSDWDASIAKNLGSSSDLNSEEYYDVEESDKGEEPKNGRESDAPHLREFSSRQTPKLLLDLLPAYSETNEIVDLTRVDSSDDSDFNKFIEVRVPSPLARAKILMRRAERDLYVKQIDQLRRNCHMTKRKRQVSSRTASAYLPLFVPYIFNDPDLRKYLRPPLRGSWPPNIEVEKKSDMAERALISRTKPHWTQIPVSWLERTELNEIRETGQKRSEMIKPVIHRTSTVGPAYDAKITKPEPTAETRKSQQIPQMSKQEYVPQMTTPEETPELADTGQSTKMTELERDPEIPQVKKTPGAKEQENKSPLNEREQTSQLAKSINQTASPNATISESEMTSNEAGTSTEASGSNHSLRLLPSTKAEPFILDSRKLSDPDIHRIASYWPEPSRSPEPSQSAKSSSLEPSSLEPISPEPFFSEPYILTEGPNPSQKLDSQIPSRRVIEEDPRTICSLPIGARFPTNHGSNPPSRYLLETPNVCSQDINAPRTPQNTGTGFHSSHAEKTSGWNLTSPQSTLVGMIPNSQLSYYPKPMDSQECPDFHIYSSQVPVPNSASISQKLDREISPDPVVKEESSSEICMDIDISNSLQSQHTLVTPMGSKPKIKKPSLPPVSLGEQLRRRFEKTGTRFNGFDEV